MWFNINQRRAVFAPRLGIETRGYTASRQVKKMVASTSPPSSHFSSFVNLIFNDLCSGRHKKHKIRNVTKQQLQV